MNCDLLNSSLYCFLPPYLSSLFPTSFPIPLPLVRRDLPLLPTVTAVQQDEIRTWMIQLGLCVVDGEGGYYPVITGGEKEEDGKW